MMYSKLRMMRVPTSTMIEMVTGHRSAMGIMFTRSVAQWSSAWCDAHHCNQGARRRCRCQLLPGRWGKAAAPACRLLPGGTCRGEGGFCACMQAVCLHCTGVSAHLLA
jgi:hypothetical protein